MKQIALPFALALAAAPAPAQQIPFAAGWTEQRFSLLSSNDFGLNGDSLGVRSDGTVSLLWTPLPPALWSGRVAAWDWRVDRSVPATDLTRKGGDDRNLSLYFLFLPEAAARAAQGRGVKALLDHPEARVLMYVWGGAHARGDLLASPYLGARGKTLILRPAGTGSASERVDLAADHRRAFGTGPARLVGVAVSADSDDTGTGVLARIDRLRIE
ncbi:MAG: DUF3047 domain-containing protein [Rhodovulum sp.]